uniref:Uncharacterized protein n=1 Tax=Romanomermis culicivorax TaxID=13658 RepID=A0A915I861_ROMCU
MVALTTNQANGFIKCHSRTTFSRQHYIPIDTTTKMGCITYDVRYLDSHVKDVSSMQLQLKMAQDM